MDHFRVICNKHRSLWGFFYFCFNNKIVTITISEEKEGPGGYDDHSIKERGPKLLFLFVLLRARHLFNLQNGLSGVNLMKNQKKKE